MGLDLNVALRSSDSEPAIFAGLLSRRDLDELREAPKLEPREPLARIRSQHHALARAIAAGMTLNQAAISVGYSLGHASYLKDDPTFKELVDFYQKKQGDLFADAATRMAGLAEDAMAELSDRLIHTPKEIPLESLMEIVKITADRSGLGPQSKQTVNVNIGIASRLEEARRRINAAKLIEGTVNAT